MVALGGSIESKIRDLNFGPRGGGGVLRWEPRAKPVGGELPLWLWPWLKRAIKL